MKRSIFLALIFGCFSAMAVEFDAAGVESWRREGSSRVIVGANVHLPSDGIWEMAKGNAPGIHERYLVVPEKALEALEGERIRDAKEAKRVAQSRWRLRNLVWNYRRYAREHGGKLPAADNELESHVAQSVTNAINRSPWQGMDQDVKGPFVHVMRNAVFVFESKDKHSQVRTKDRQLLAFELRPYIDDGKHWVAYTDGQTERKQIDANLVATEKVTIRPVHSGDVKRPETFEYRLLLLVDAEQVDELKVAIANSETEAVASIDVTLSGAAEGKDLQKELTSTRENEWMFYAKASQSPMLSVWGMRTSGGRRSRRDRVPSAYSLLGGRAAVQETMQLQVLRSATSSGEQVIDVSTLEGVAAESHPYDEMLGKSEVVAPKFLNYCPTNRLVLYLPDASQVSGFIDSGADYIAEMGTMATGRRLDYGIVERHLGRMGLTRELLEQLLKSGWVKECAVIAADPLFIDGTDITVVARVEGPGMQLARLISGGAKAGEVTSFGTFSGRDAFLLQSGEALIISSNRGELDRVAALVADGPEGSLGASAELRYMLTQLPLTQSTRAYIYMSDAFLRRLTGPDLKIGQARRVAERARMEVVTSAALLARKDGFGNVTSAAELKRLGYLPASMNVGDFTIAQDGRVRSAKYGSLRNMSTLLDHSVEKVTEREKEAYAQYVRSYNRFWREFYDPIAIRFDGKEDGCFEVETFILPLVDSVAYEGLRKVLVTAETGRPLVIPDLEPDPVAMASVNVSPRIWSEMLGEIAFGLATYTGLDTRIFDLLGPGMHLAIHDADPVIALGSGDVLGAFNAGTAFGNDAEVVAIPALLSVLTRPCSIMIETRDPDATRRMLVDSASSGWVVEEDWMSISMYQVGEEPRWTLVFDFGGVIKLRFGLSVEDRWVVLRNIPWAENSHVADAVASEFATARVEVHPEACVTQARALFTAAHERQSDAAMDGCAMLYPLVWTDAVTQENMLEEHKRLFGYAPRHPGTGGWRIEDGVVVSTTYGSLEAPRIPAFDPNAASGALFEGLHDIELEMQFEHSGLRSVLRWRTE